MSVKSAWLSRIFDSDNLFHYSRIMIDWTMPPPFEIETTFRLDKTKNMIHHAFALSVFLFDDDVLDIKSYTDMEIP